MKSLPRRSRNQEISRWATLLPSRHQTRRRLRDSWSSGYGQLTCFRQEHTHQLADARTERRLRHTYLRLV